MTIRFRLTGRKTPSTLPILKRNALGREISNGAELNNAIDVWNALPVCSGVNQIPCHAGPILGHVDPNLHFGDNFNSLDHQELDRLW